MRAVISAQRSIQTGSPQLSRGIAGAEMVTRASDRGKNERAYLTEEMPPGTGAADETVEKRISRAEAPIGFILII